MGSDEHETGDRAEPRDLVQQRLAIALDSAGIGSWELDLASGEFRGDARLLELFGFPADTAADVALRTVRDHLLGETGIIRVTFVLRGAAVNAFRRRLVDI